MKRIIAILSFICLFLTAGAQSLTIKVSGIRSNKGNIMIGMGDYKQAPQTMIGRMVKADSTGVTCIIDSLPFAEQHIYLYHAESADFNPSMISQFMQPTNAGNANEGKQLQQSDKNQDAIPEGGFGIDVNGSWEPLVKASSEPQTLNFVIIYQNFK